MARKGSATVTETDETSTTPATDEVVTTTTESTDTPAADAKPEVDLTAFEAALDAALADMSDDNRAEVTKQYQALDRTGKGKATSAVTARSKSAVEANDRDAAWNLQQIKQTNLVAASSSGTSSTPAAPANPTDSVVERIVGLRIAYNLATANLPDGVDADWSDKVEAAVTDEKLNADVQTLVAWTLSTDDERGDKPEVSKQASDIVRIALSGRGGRKSGGVRSAYSGPNRSVGKHIGEAFASVDSGGFLLVNEIVKFDSTEYGSDHPSPGAVSAAIKSGKSLPAGLTMSTDANGKLGLTKA